jgi:ABC-2 type transport system ATP-binding protein
VKYTVNGEPRTELVADATERVRELFAAYDRQVADLQVHKISLEDIYLKLVNDADGESQPDGVDDFAEVRA